MSTSRNRNITRMRANSNKIYRTSSASESRVQSYGEILSQTRLNHGLSIRDVAEELHVREDILIALENGDFNAIPPQGYSRNMIKSYSRLLGLNANKITDMFLDAEFSHRIGKKRASIQEIRNQNKQRMPEVSTNSAMLKTPREQIEEKNKFKSERERNNKTTSLNRTSPFSNRTTHTYQNKYKNTPRARREYDTGGEMHRGGGILNNSADTRDDIFGQSNYMSAKERLKSRQKANRLNTVSGYAQNNHRQNTKYSRNPYGGSSINKRHHLGRQDINKPQYEDIPTNPQVNTRTGQRLNFMQIDNSDKVAASRRSIKLPFIIVIVAFLVIILILFLFMMGKHQENSKTDVSNIQVTGLTDPDKDTNTNNNNNQSNNLVEPTSVDFTFKVADGKTAYIEIYENGSSTATLAQTCTSGQTSTYKVTSTLKFVTTSPSNVSISVNGEVVNPSDDDGNGVYIYELNFQQYLNDWKTKNKVTNSSSNSSNTSTNNSNSSTNNNINSRSNSSSTTR